MLFSAELPVWFYCVQENGFLGISENFGKIHRKSTHQKLPPARSGARGAPGTWLVRPHPWPRRLAAWGPPPSSGALLRPLFISVTGKPRNRSRFSSFRRGASATLCSSLGGLIWRLFGLRRGKIVAIVITITNPSSLHDFSSHV